MFARYCAIFNSEVSKLSYRLLGQMLIKLLVVAIAYYSTAKLGLMVPYNESTVTLLWLPTGIATGAIMRWGKINVIAIFIAAYLVEYSNLPQSTSLVIAFGNTFAPLVASYCLQYFKFNHSLVRQVDIGLLIASALLSMSISASVGVLSLYNGDLISSDAVLRVWLVWWLGDSMGVLLALPLVLNLTKETIQISSKQSYQLIAWLLVFAGCEYVISTIIPSLNKQFMLSVFLIMPALIWATMHFGVVGGSIVVICLSAIVVWITAQGFGAFYSIDAGEGVFSLWMFIVSLILVMLLIAVLQSDRVLTAKSALNNEKKLRAIVNGALDGIVTIDEEGNITEFNVAAEDIFGYKQDELIGKSLSDIMVPPSARAAHNDGHALFVKTGIKHIVDKRVELIAMRSDGSEFPIELSITSLKESGFPLVTAFIRDISLQKKAQLEIENLAYYDVLTGLPNRRLLLDRFQRAVVNAKRLGTSCVLIFLDLDNFKLLNDTRGHEIGDKLLVEVAKRLESSVRAGDTVARLSGDEFIVILENIDNDKNLAYQQASEVAQKLLMSLNKSYSLALIEYTTTASLGLTLFNGDDTTMTINHHPKTSTEPEDLLSFEDHLRHADVAMYQAKSAGRSTFRFYDSITQKNADRYHKIEAKLNSEIQNNELSLHYQGIVDTDQNVVSAEVLLRWTHPVLGSISPEEFIPIAEKTNQIIRIGYWVLSQACHQLKAWESSEHLSKLRLSINISAKQFMYLSFVQDVREILKNTQINPNLLKLELTETAVIDNIDDVIHKFNALRKMGLQIALDDFGMGHSSLVYLKRLPITTIKIDQSFVKDMLTDTNDKAIIQMILAIGKTINCKIVAEGIEQLAQFEALKSYGCNFFKDITLASHSR